MQIVAGILAFVILSFFLILLLWVPVRAIIFRFSEGHKVYKRIVEESGFGKKRTGESGGVRWFYQKTGLFESVIDVRIDGQSQIRSSFCCLGCGYWRHVEWKGFKLEDWQCEMLAKKVWKHFRYSRGL
jgi:hypothetical protein